MVGFFLSQTKFPPEFEEEYLRWVFERRKKFIVWVAGVVILFLLYFTFVDVLYYNSLVEQSVTISLRAVEILLSFCVVFIYLRVDPLLAQRKIFICMLLIVIVAIFDSYFRAYNMGYVFNSTGTMFAVYIFMIIPYGSVVHRFLLGAVFVCGMLLCSMYLGMPANYEIVFYVLVIFISEMAISYKIDTLLRGQFRAVHEEKKRTTELRKREKELKKALEAEREAIKQNLNFIDMISHEYRTPLAIITSCVDSLETLAVVNNSECASHTVKTIREASRRLLSIYQSSLHEKRINAAGIMPYKKRVDLITIVELAVDFVRSSYPEHSILIDDAVCPEIMVIADSELLTTALINVLDNACKYSLPSRVDVGLECESSNCIIQIRDKGFGIEQSEIGVVFEKYYRSGMTKQKPGAGVGLYLVKKIVELHKGDINLDSKRNAGTTVVISLPLSKDDDE